MKALTALFLILCVSITLVAQIKVPKFPTARDLPLPGLDRLLRGESPVSTSLTDARMEAPWLDSLDMKFGDLGTLRNNRGAFTVTPGNWATELHSFCFRPGTRGPRPTDGQGYVSAPIAGPHGQIFADMLTKYALQRDIEQRDMQVLIWALLSRTKIRQMNPQMQALAVRVLTPAQMVALDSGALDVIPPDLRRRAFNALPAEIRAVAEVENRIRDVLYRGNHTYAQLERLAVLQGPEPRDGRQIPKQRWTVHPNGFLVRYVPRGMARTTVQIVKPQPVTIRRDARGRIVSIDFADGRRTETEYDDAIAPYDSPRYRTLAYRFKTIRMIRPGPGGKPRELVLRDRGWTFVMRRGGRRAPRFVFATYRQPESGWADLISDIKERYDEWTGRAEAYEGVVKTATGEPRDVEDALRDLEDSEHYHDGIEAALEGDAGDRADFIIDHHERQAEVVKAATVVIGTLPTTSTTEDEYVPPYDVAIPGSSGSQRLGMSGRF
jgi:hypothetical protein